MLYRKGNEQTTIIFISVSGCPREIGPIGCREKKEVGFIIGTGSRDYGGWQVPRSAGWVDKLETQ